MTRSFLLGGLGSLVLAAPLWGQTGCWGLPPTPGAVDSVALLAPRTMLASRVRAEPPVIDGRLTEPSWCDAIPSGDLVQSRPAPGRLATLPTVIRILFDDTAVYVAVRLFDPGPDSIAAPFPRRDDEVTSDWVFVEFDTRFDRRSGFSFGLNPRGVQVDGTWWDDVFYDPAWNGVWDGAAQVEADGWTAEFRIPFSQVALGRSTPGVRLTWGINVYRTTPHRGETSNWSPRLPTVSGIVSRFNRLEGITAPPHGARLELVPYGSLTGVTAPQGAKDGVSNRLGVDVRFRPTATTAALLSVHPDFGQVEADPSQVNLTTFETFLPEQRPLFVEGADVFQFDASLAFASRGASFGEENPFYSRRVGRPPQASPPAGVRAADLPAATTVLGALRLSARSPSGWSGGAFQAWTGSEQARSTDSLGRHRVQLEPLTSYSVVRAVREARDGQSAAGLMLTAVNRFDLSGAIDSQLPRDAFVAGADARWRRGRNELTGFVLGSRVTGSPAAIAGLRAQPRHGEDGPSAADTGRVHRSLNGVTAQARLVRTEGRLRWGLAGRYVARGFEANDAGFQRNANWLLLSGDWQYQVYRPARWLRRWSVGSKGLGVGWTTTGELRAATANLTVGADLRSYWGGSLSFTHEFPAADPEVLRGGPSLLLPARDRAAFQLYSDTRRRWQLAWSATAEGEPGSDSRRLSLTPGLSAFVTDRLQLGLTPGFSWIREGWQFIAHPQDQSGDPRYLLGRLDQREAGLTTRATYAFSPHLTLQWYAQVFISSGQYLGFAEVRKPKAASAGDRVLDLARARVTRDPAGGYQVDAGTDSSVVFQDPAFAERVLNHNLVLRWEFLPGSTLFLVWTEERRHQRPAPFQLGRDLRWLTRKSPTDALQLKLSYWLSP
jgi:hypothetical protein